MIYPSKQLKSYQAGEQSDMKSLDFVDFLVKRNKLKKQKNSWDPKAESLKNDIALVELFSPLTLSEKVKPAIGLVGEYQRNEKGFSYFFKTRKKTLKKLQKIKKTLEKTSNTQKNAEKNIKYSKKRSKNNKSLDNWLGKHSKHSKTKYFKKSPNSSRFNLSLLCSIRW